jgi:hypothetical protein
VARNVLLLGLKGVIVDDVKDQVQVADIQLFGGTGIDDVRTTFERTSIDSVIMGGASTWRPASRTGVPPAC